MQRADFPIVGLTKARDICTVFLNMFLNGVIQMPIQITYTNARASLAKLLDEVTENHEVVVITRRGSEDVAMISAAELSCLMETAHLLRSPKNAKRLLTALNRALARTTEPGTVGELRREVGLDKEP